MPKILRQIGGIIRCALPYTTHYEFVNCFAVRKGTDPIMWTHQQEGDA